MALPLPVRAVSCSPQRPRPRTEYFTGFEASDNYASGYVGAGYAFGKGLATRSGLALARRGRLWPLSL